MSPPSPVEWRLASREHRRDDRRGLQNFVCTHPEKAQRSAATGWQFVHPRFWEHDVQQMIRSLAAKVPPARGASILLGYAKDGLVAVSSWVEAEGPGSVHLGVLGVAQHRREAGGSSALARELMRETFARIEQAAIEAGESSMYVEGEIWHENGSSLRLCGDAGFSFVGEESPGVLTYGKLTPLEEAYVP